MGSCGRSCRRPSQARNTARRRRERGDALGALLLLQLQLDLQLDLELLPLPGWVEGERGLRSVMGGDGEWDSRFSVGDGEFSSDEEDKK